MQTPLRDKEIEQLKAEMDRLQTIFSEESDRGAALMAAAFLDVMLEKLLRARFGERKLQKLIEPLFEGFGPLSTFSAKIRVSYAIGLLQDWMASELNLIRAIRNEFAHDLGSRKFQDPKISRMVDRLASFDQSQKEWREKIGAEMAETREKLIPVCWFSLKWRSNVFR